MRHIDETIRDKEILSEICELEANNIEEKYSAVNNHVRYTVGYSIRHRNPWVVVTAEQKDGSTASFFSQLSLEDTQKNIDVVRYVFQQVEKQIQSCE